MIKKALFLVLKKNATEEHLPSLNLIPSEPVLLARSEPATSTRCSLAHRYSSFKLPLSVESVLILRICSTLIVKMACERLQEKKNKIFMTAMSNLEIIITQE